MEGEMDRNKGVQISRSLNVNCFCCQQKRCWKCNNSFLSPLTDTIGLVHFCSLRLCSDYYRNIHKKKTNQDVDYTGIRKPGLSKDPNPAGILRSGWYFRACAGGLSFPWRCSLIRWSHALSLLSLLCVKFKVCARSVAVVSLRMVN